MSKDKLAEQINRAFAQIDIWRIGSATEKHPEFKSLNEYSDIRQAPSSVFLGIQRTLEGVVNLKEQEGLYKSEEEKKLDQKKIHILEFAILDRETEEALQKKNQAEIRAEKNRQRQAEEEILQKQALKEEKYQKISNSWKFFKNKLFWPTSVILVIGYFSSWSYLSWIPNGAHLFASKVYVPFGLNPFAQKNVPETQDEGVKSSTKSDEGKLAGITTKEEVPYRPNMNFAYKKSLESSVVSLSNLLTLEALAKFDKECPANGLPTDDPRVFHAYGYPNDHMAGYFMKGSTEITHPENPLQKTPMSVYASGCKPSDRDKRILLHMEGKGSNVTDFYKIMFEGVTPKISDKPIPAVDTNAPDEQRIEQAKNISLFYDRYVLRVVAKVRTNKEGNKTVTFHEEASGREFKATPLPAPKIDKLAL